MRKLLTVTTFTGLLTILRMSAGFLIAKVIAVYLGPVGMAILGQMQNIIAVLNGIIYAPINPALIRYTAENYDGTYTKCIPWWKAGVRWTVLFLLIIIPISCIFSSKISYWLFNSSEYKSVIIITLLSLPFSVAGSMINAINNGLQRFKKYIIMGMISVVISTTGIILLIVYAGTKGALVAIALQNSLIGIVLLCLSFNESWLKVSHWFGKVDKQCMKSIAKYILMALTSSLTLPIALICIRQLLIKATSWEDAGQWQAVWKISDAYLAVMTLALSTYYLPQLSKIKDIYNLKKEINSVAKVIIPLTILSALAIYLFRDFIISTLFTRDFTPAREYFLIQLMGDIVKIIAWIYAYPMIAYGIAKWYICGEIAFSLIFVGLSYSTISTFGVHGANISYLASYSLYFIIIYIYFDKIIVFKNEPAINGKK